MDPFAVGRLFEESIEWQDKVDFDRDPFRQGPVRLEKGTPGADIAGEQIEDILSPVGVHDLDLCR
jgi:hypothetical protein